MKRGTRPVWALISTSMLLAVGLPGCAGTGLTSAPPHRGTTSASGRGTMGATGPRGATGATGP